MGMPLFMDVVVRPRFKLDNVKEYESGIVELRYFF